MTIRTKPRLIAFLAAALAGSALPISAADPPGIDLARQLSDAFVSVADKVSPSVVVIRVVEKARRSRFGGRARPPEEGEGSGIIVSGDGYILTNNHVVENADTITVVLRDGRQFDGEVKGTEPENDIAVVKIKPKGAKLTVARLGDSSKLRVGEFVIAIGHPYDLDYSVTVGHVSAIERVLPRDSYDTPTDYEPDYIQTDAVINPGNSGGPLINLDGEVIGINAMIEADTVPFTRVSVSRGIGLAVPINVAKAIKDRLISEGKFTRSRIGVDLSDPGAAAYVNVEMTVSAGVPINDVISNAPAAKAGVKRGDVIVSVDGNPVKNRRDLIDMVAFKPPGQTLLLGVLRDSKPRIIKVTTESVPQSADIAEAEQNPEVPITDYGFSVKTLTAAIVQRMGNGGVTNGVVVTGVDAVSLAASQRINVDVNSGDIITKFNNAAVTTAEEFAKKLKAVPAGKQWTMEVLQKGDTEAHFKVYHAPAPQSNSLAP